MFLCISIRISTVPTSAPYKITSSRIARMIRFISLAYLCTIVAVLATTLTLVDGFSTAPRMGWKNAVIHRRFQNNRPAQQLYMTSDKEDDISSAQEISDVEETNEKEKDIDESQATDVIIDETEEVQGEVVADNNAIEEVQEEETSEVEEDASESEIESESATVVIDEASEGETIEEEEDDSEREATAVAVTIDGTDEVEVKVKEEEVIVEEDEVGEIETVAVATNETAEMDVAEDDGEDTDKSDNDTLTQDDDDSKEGEQEEIFAESKDSVDVVDEAEGGEDIEDTVVEPIVYFADRGGDSDETSTNAIKEFAEDERKGLDLDLIAMVAGNIAKDVLSVLRFGAANFLTASLPENQREDLLKRMGATALPPASETADKVKEAAAEIAAEKIEEERASIQEEIAMARAEEAQKSEMKWEQQKEEILQEMEMAASARVENELKIQMMKLEEETTKSLLEKDQALQAEKELYEKIIQEEKEKMESVDDLFAIKTDEEIARNEELEALVEKRQNQQIVLESLERELRDSVSNEEEQREQLQAMIEKRLNQQEELNTVEAQLRDQVKEIESEKSRYQDLVDGLNVMKEKAQELQQEADTSPGDSSDNDETQEGADGESRDEVGSVEEPEHPVLGPVVVDLGYKRIHLVSAGKLGTISVWNRNRTYRNNRAKSMAAEKIKSMDLGFPGVIGLHEAASGKLSIVDGQHRVGMLAALKEIVNKKIEKGDSDDTYEDVFGEILVEVYPEPESSAPANGDAFAEKVFLEINKAEPVKLIDMPGVASAADRKVITEAVETLYDQFRPMFSSSQRCRIPNVNVDNLRSIVFGANILKRHKLTTSKKLVEWLLERNAALGDEYESDDKKQKLVSKKQWTKASANTFYLGLESSWLYK